MSEADRRAQYVAVLRAIADAVEADETMPVLHGYLTAFSPSAEATAALLRTVPLPWVAKSPAPDQFHFEFTGDLGNYVSDGIRIYVFNDPADVATAGEAKPVTVTEWTPLPELAALLATPEPAASPS